MSTVGSRSQRAPSPSNTTYSGISSYRSEAYRPIGKPPALPPIDTRKVAKTHFDEIQAYLGEHGKGISNIVRIVPSITNYPLPQSLKTLEPVQERNWPDLQNSNSRNCQLMSTMSLCGATITSLGTKVSWVKVTPRGQHVFTIFLFL
jgi:hypothetical protein